MFLFAIIIIIVLVYLIAGPHHHMRFDPTRSSEAEELLKKRFVNGEIDEETYKKMLRALRSN